MEKESTQYLWDEKYTLSKGDTTSLCCGYAAFMLHIYLPGFLYSQAIYWFLEHVVFCSGDVDLNSFLPWYNL